MFDLCRRRRHPGAWHHSWRVVRAKGEQSASSDLILVPTQGGNDARGAREREDRARGYGMTTMDAEDPSKINLSGDGVQLCRIVNSLAQVRLLRDGRHWSPYNDHIHLAKLIRRNQRPRIVAVREPMEGVVTC